MNNHLFFKGQDKGGKREIETHPKWQIPKGQCLDFSRCFQFFLPKEEASTEGQREGFRR